MAPMTSRECVLAAVNHEEPDRVPLIVGVDHTTSIMIHAYRRLKKHLGFEAEERYMYGTWKELGSVRVDEEILQRLGSDGRGVWDRRPRAVEERNERRGPDVPYVDEYGVGQIETVPEEWFPGINPMREAALETIETYPWPDMDDMTQYAGIRERTAELAREGQYAIFGAPWLLFPFERANQLQGMDVFMMNMVENPDFARALFARLVDLYKRRLGHLLDAMDGHCDVIMMGDDLGMQSGILMSPQMYRELLKPYHADLLSFIRQRTSAKIWFHSDGDIFRLLDDLVEIGVQILNPIQTSTGGLGDLPRLKQRYGKNLCFCGAIDTHRILPFGTPEEVRQEVRRAIAILGPGGGYMVASVHSMMSDVPPENILAMADAVKEFGRYPLG